MVLVRALPPASAIIDVGGQFDDALFCYCGYRATMALPVGSGEAEPPRQRTQ